MPTDISFEHRFGQLVDAELNEKLPSLVEYRVGFQVIDKTEDEKKAVGIYAFVMNNTWIYIPIFFIDGKLEGFEIMYIKQKDMFVPAMDNWIAAINEQGVQVLGSAVNPEQEVDEGISATPENTNTFVSNGSMSKVASCAEAFGDNSYLEKEAVDKMFTFYSDIKKEQIPSLERMLPMLSKEAKALFVNTLLKEPEFGNALFKHYNADQIEKMAKECVIHRTAAQVPNSSEGIHYITNKMSKEARELDEKEKKLLVKHNLYIKDHRTNFTEVYMENVDTSIWQNPCGSGIFDVLLADGTSEKRIIISPRELDRGPSVSRRESSNVKRSIALIKLDGSADFEWRKANEIYCKPATGLDSSLTNNHQGGMRGSLRGLRDVPEGAHLMFVQMSKPSNSIKTTLKRRRKDASGSIVVTLEGTTGHCTGDPSIDNYPCEVTIQFTEKGELCVMGDIMYVPSDLCRVFVDYPRWMKYRKDLNKGPNGGEIEPITYGTPKLFRDVAYGVNNNNMGRVEVTMSPNGGYGSVKDANGHSDLMPKEAVAQVLCEGFHISGKNAMRMMKHAAQEGGKSGFILKVAAPFDMAAYRGASFVPFMGGPAGREDQHTIHEESQTRRGRALTGPSAADGSSLLPQDAIDKAQQASEAGIKEVMDVTVLQQLIDKGDISELRKDNISEMIQGMDSIGRTLFLYYWHNDQFEEKYGRDKMRELQEHLKEVFNATGDLVLFLKEKTTFNPDQTESLFGNISENVATAETD